MSEASTMPITPSRQGKVPVASRLALRHKGLVLFVAMSFYVISGLGLLAWHGVASTVATGDPNDGVPPLIAAALSIVMLGLVVFGALLTLFLRRLAADLGRLQARAIEVASGVRGAPLGIERDDEVGALACAVDRMAADLQEREIEIAEARLAQFHNERMSLLGGIAAGVAHEIGNPVAGIVAIATEIDVARRAGCAASCDTGQLVALAEQLAALTRRLAVVTGQRSRDPAPVSLNAVVESMTTLIALDTRFSGIDITCNLDHSLPALVVAEDDVVQLLLHLLANAAESFGERGRERLRIRVTTALDGAWVSLEVGDNGHGMSADTLARAFEPYFTTKAAGRGNGLGLDACRRIVERYGGSIALRSTAGEGTDASCRFPARALSGWGAL